MLNPENNVSRNFVIADLKEWMPAEYEVGHSTVFGRLGIPDGESLLGCGWEDANTELSENLSKNCGIGRKRRFDYRISNNDTTQATTKGPSPFDYAQGQVTT